MVIVYYIVCLLIGFFGVKWFVKKKEVSGQLHIIRDILTGEPKLYVELYDDIESISSKSTIVLCVSKRNETRN